MSEEKSNRLGKVNSPEDIKDLNVRELEELGHELRQYPIQAVIWPRALVLWS